MTTHIKIFNQQHEVGNLDVDNMASLKLVVETIYDFTKSNGIGTETYMMHFQAPYQAPVQQRTQWSLSMSILERRPEGIKILVPNDLYLSDMEHLNFEWVLRRLPQTNIVEVEIGPRFSEGLTNDKYRFEMNRV